MTEGTPRSIQIGPREIPYLLRRSRRRSLGMTVDARGLVVTIPLQATIRDTEAFIRGHAAWVIEKLDEWAERRPAEKLELVDGARMPVLGQPCVLRLATGLPRARWVEGPFERELVLPQRPGLDTRLLMRRVLQQYALTYFGGRLDEYMLKLNVFAPDVRRPRLALTSARTRWGSCSRHSGIRLNWRLIHLDHHLVDYVVAHEVAHLLEMNHSPRFWAVVEALCPEWREARATLKHLGEQLPEF
jgi:predicted metal-dependent hydrolase